MLFILNWNETLILESLNSLWIPIISIFDNFCEIRELKQEQTKVKKLTLKITEKNCKVFIQTLKYGFFTILIVDWEVSVRDVVAQ